MLRLAFDQRRDDDDPGRRARRGMARRCYGCACRTAPEVVQDRIARRVAGEWPPAHCGEARPALGRSTPVLPSVCASAGTRSRRPTRTTCAGCSGRASRSSPCKAAPGVAALAAMTATRRPRPRANPRGSAPAGALAVPADRRLRVPVRLPHRRAARAGRHGRVAVRAALRRAERLRRAARPRRRRLPPRAVRHDRPGRAALRAGHEHRRDDVDDAVRLARRARRADDRPVAGQRATRRRTRARRPTPTPTACSCARSRASRAACRSS